MSTAAQRYAATLQILADVFGDCIRFDETRQRIVCASIPRSLGHFPDGDWTSTHTTELVIYCEGRKIYVSHHAAARAVKEHIRRRFQGKVSGQAK